MITLLIPAWVFWPGRIQPAERRTKEIGIRKVMGANVRPAGCVVVERIYCTGTDLHGSGRATGVAGYDGTAESFCIPYPPRLVDICPHLRGGCTDSLAAVGFQAIRAAMANPVKSLRTSKRAA